MKISRKIKYLPINSIRPNPYQPRKDFNEKALEELAQSIKIFGVIQPISVRKINRDSYELIAGERRLRASELADLKVIPAIQIQYMDKESAVIALVENLQRENLNFIEEAEGFYSLIEDHNFTQVEIAEKLGKSQSTIANKIRLLKLPKDIQNRLLEENLTERHGRALLKLLDDDLRRVALDKIITNNLNVSATENLIDGLLNNISKKDNSKGNIKSLINVRIYLNTIKKAYKAINEYGINAEYDEKDKGEYVLVTIKVPKSVENKAKAQ